MAQDTKIKIGKKTIGAGRPAYLIFEVASTHGGDFDAAAAYVKQAADAGADAVKFQLFEADKLLNPIVKNLKRAHAYFKRSEVPREWFPKLKKLCDKHGIDLLCTPFDEESADFLNDVGVSATKIASGDMTHLPLLRHITRHGKPVLLSTGTATMDEVRMALDTLRRGGCNDIVILQCVSVYPMAFEQANVAVLDGLRREFKTFVGYSDNGSPGFLVPLVATALGAAVVEKHVTSKKERGDLDDTFSLSVEDFAEMAQKIRMLERKPKEAALRYIKDEYGEEAFRTVLGSEVKKPAPPARTRGNVQGGVSAPSEYEERYWVRRGAYPARDIQKGERISEDMLVFLRPDVGVSALFCDELVGKVALEALPSHQPILLEDKGVRRFRRKEIDRHYGDSAEAVFISSLKKNALF